MKRNYLRPLVAVAFEITHENRLETDVTMASFFHRFVSRQNAAGHGKRACLAVKN